MLRIRTCLASLLLSLTGIPAAADVLVVDAGGGADFTDLPAAVAAAQSGDVLLVKTGLYQGFTLAGNSLSVVADEGATVQINDSVEVSDVGGLERIVLAGLRVSGRETVSSSVDSSALRIHNSGGHLRVQGCTLTGGAGQDPACVFGHLPESDGGAAALLTGSGKIIFTRCQLTGGDGGRQPFSFACFCNFGGVGGEGLDLHASQAALYDCTLLGGTGGEAPLVGGDGGHGVRARLGSALFLGATSATGGRGSTAWDVVAFQDGDGGHGALIESGAVGFLAGATLVGGLFRGGSSIAGNGQPGNPLENLGTVTSYPIDPPRMQAPHVAREGGPLAFTVSGTPGSSIYVLRSHTPIYALIPNQTGLLGTPGVSDLAHAILGELPASGSASFLMAVEQLPRGVEHDTIYLQVVAYDPSVAHSVLGTPHALTVLDSGF